jgi:hypothetical protein
MFHFSNRMFLGELAYSGMTYFLPVCASPSLLYIRRWPALDRHTDVIHIKWGCSQDVSKGRILALHVRLPYISTKLHTNLVSSLWIKLYPSRY